MDSGKAGGSGAAEQPRQYRLGLIVRGVSYGYARGQALFDDAIKECVTEASGGVFEIQMLPRSLSRNILPLADILEAELARQVGYKLRVGFRVRSAQGVVKMRYEQRDAERVPKIGKKPQQRHGIGASRNSHGHAIARGRHPRLADRFQNLPFER